MLLFLLLFTVSAQAQFQYESTIQPPGLNQFIDSTTVVVLLWDGEAVSETVAVLFERYEIFTDFDDDPPRPIRYVIEYGFATVPVPGRPRVWIRNPYVLTTLRIWTE